MTKAIFGKYIDYDEEEKLAHIYVKADMLMPLNISLEDGSDLDLIEKEQCVASIWSNEYYSLGVYTPQEWEKDGGLPSPRKLIPSGTFPADSYKNPNWEENFKQNATVIFSGTVIIAERTIDPVEEDPRWKLLIDCYGISFWLYYYEDELVEPGYIADGVAWLSGKLKRAK